MAARRQPSTTSLSRYARTSSPIQQKSSDFCNAFWGLGDGGVDVLFARMRGAQRSMDELRNYWKERAIIEEDYAKRLAKLSKITLGRDEIGELRNSFDTLRLETDKQATSHLQLAGQIRELEGQAATFLNKQVHHKKVYQGSVEKAFKAKQTQESYVNKSREKYEADCIRINSYTAQSTLMQGKDLDKIRLKLERSQQTVQSNERDFANFAKALADTTHKWEQDWKVFCDLCQDLEEDRLEFMKDNMWAYANAISGVCVSDDESCEKVRVALEQMDPEKEMENFVRDYGTGSQIPDPPPFINYAAPDAIPSSATRPTTHPARYNRNTNRPAKTTNAPAEDEEPVQNTAGVGAGGGAWRDTEREEVALSRQPTQSRGRSQSISQATNQNQSTVNGAHTREGGSNEVNGSHSYHNGPSRPSSVSPHPQMQPQSQQPSQTQPPAQSSLSRRPTSVSPQPPKQTEQPRILHDPLADPIDPRAETFIKVGDNAYKVDLSKDPQQSSSNSPFRNDAAGPSRQSLAAPQDQEDPLAKQMKELQRAVSTSGSVRRKSVAAAQSQSQNSPQKSTSTPGPSSSLSAPGNARQTPSPAAGGSTSHPQQTRDYRMPAESVIGTYPAASTSRAPSPKPPTAEFMRPQHSGQRVGGADVIDTVVADYEQSLPGERKSISRRGSYVGPSPSQFGAQQHTSSSSQGQNLTRPPSQIGHAGIGAHGSRSPSPQPIQPMMQGPSPTPSPSRGGYAPPNHNHNLGLGHPNTQNHRAVSPNNVGIALDPSGRVLHDEMANRYQQPRQPSIQQHQPQQHQPQQQQSQQPIHQQPTGYNQQPRRTSYMAPTHTGMAPPPNQQQGYGAPGSQVQQQYVPPPPPLTYQHQQQQQPSYGSMQHIPPQPTYTPAPYQQPPMQQQQPMYQQQPMGGGYGSGSMGSVGRNMSLGAGNGYYNGPPNGVPQQQQQQQQQQQGLRQPQQQQPYREPSPAMQAPAQPTQGQVTGQTTENGQPILFYVQALYDYTATIEEEFDFQAGDIIAVTATPEDGWWSGELLDEGRRRRGQHIFPSNFVRLF